MMSANKEEVSAIIISDDEALQMVRQARKIRPKPGLVTIAELSDVAVLAAMGGAIFSVTLGVIACLLPGATSDIISILSCAFAAGIAGALLFMASAIVPIFFPVALLILQIVSGASVGAIVFNALCAWFGVDPASMPFFAQAASTVLTTVFAILPIVFSPLYFALALSSRWQTTFGWSTVGLMVCDQNGRRPTFKQALIRTMLRMWWPIVFPGRLSHTNLIDDWVEEHSKTALVLKPANLKAALIRARDEVHRSKDRVVIIAHSATINSRLMQEQSFSRNASSVKSDEAVKQLLKPDWQSVVLRVEAYFVAMLGILFIARYNIAIWTQHYFYGYPTDNNLFWFSQFLVNNRIGQAAPFLIMMFYLSLFFYARRSLPQILQMTPEGFGVSSYLITSRSNRKLFKNTAAGPNKAWADVVNIYLEDKAGRESDEKWLVFSMRNSAPVKIRLDIIRSISSKEELLNAIERWAPNVPRDADLISFLQPPSDFSYTEIWMEALSAPPKRDKLKPLITGAVLKENQYRIIRLIAVGGQGSVYLAKDSVTDEEVVLKEFVLPVYVDLSIKRKTIEKFEREARLLKALEHPQVVQLLDYFVEDHRAYLVLEHLDGQNLRDLVQQSGKMIESDVIPLAMQMCEILKYLHGQDPPVIHRDFTPDNLILGKDGKLHLIDFNVAQSLDNTATTTGTVVGKPSYLAPEQFQGEPTALSDLYSMGASLFYLLTAAEPLPIAQSRPASISPDVSTTMDLIVSTCTSYDVAMRYQSVTDLQTALQKAGKQSSDF